MTPKKKAEPVDPREDLPRVDIQEALDSEPVVEEFVIEAEEEAKATKSRKSSK